jgi:hypothetical protein
MSLLFYFFSYLNRPTSSPAPPNLHYNSFPSDLDLDLRSAMAPVAACPPPRAGPPPPIPPPHTPPQSLLPSRLSPHPSPPRTRRQPPANASRTSMPSSVMTSSPTSANTTCRRSPLTITDACVPSRAYTSLSLTQSLQSMDYNVPGGKLNRGLSVVDSVAILKGRELTESEYFKAAVLGWSVEWVRPPSPPSPPRRGLIP